MNQQPTMSLKRFEQEYQGQPAWDTGAPQHRLVKALAELPPESPVLDIGCGTGELAIHAATLGHDVTGIDFSPTAIRIAQSKASTLYSNLSFKVEDVFTLKDLGIKFSAVLDCCFFHMLDGPARQTYHNVLSAIIKPGGRLYMLNFAVQLPTPNAPQAVSQQDILSVFHRGWIIRELEAAQVDVTFLPQGVSGTYACIEKSR